MKKLPPGLGDTCVGKKKDYSGGGEYVLLENNRPGKKDDSLCFLRIVWGVLFIQQILMQLLLPLPKSLEPGMLRRVGGSQCRRERQWLISHCVLGHDFGLAQSMSDRTGHSGLMIVRGFQTEETLAQDGHIANMGQSHHCSKAAPLHHMFEVWKLYINTFFIILGQMSASSRISVALGNAWLFFDVQLFLRACFLTVQNSQHEVGWAFGKTTYPKTLPILAWRSIVNNSPKHMSRVTSVAQGNQIGTKVYELTIPFCLQMFLS